MLAGSPAGGGWPWSATASNNARRNSFSLSVAWKPAAALAVLTACGTATQLVSGFPHLFRPTSITGSVNSQEMPVLPSRCLRTVARWMVLPRSVRRSPTVSNSMVVSMSAVIEPWPRGELPFFGL